MEATRQKRCKKGGHRERELQREGTVKGRPVVRVLQ